MADDLNPSYRKKLIADLKIGSTEAFKIIYDMYAPRLYRFAYTLTKSSLDSADIVQEVFVRLWENRDRISDDKPLESFLFVIGRNLFVTAYRKRLSSQRYADYTEYLDSFQTTDTAASAMEYDEYKRSLSHAFKLLPMRQRQIIHLSKWKGMKNSEIARKLNLSEQTVKNQLSLGLKTLKMSLAKIELPVIFLFFLHFES